MDKQAQAKIAAQAYRAGVKLAYEQAVSNMLHGLESAYSGLGLDSYSDEGLGSMGPPGLSRLLNASTAVAGPNAGWNPYGHGNEGPYRTASALNRSYAQDLDNPKITGDDREYSRNRTNETADHVLAILGAMNRNMARNERREIHPVASALAYERSQAKPLNWRAE
jgi:hypothetical protein